MRAHTHAAFNENCYWWLLLSVYFLRGSLAGLETRSGSCCYSLLIKPSQLLRSAISCLFCHRDAVDVSSLSFRCFPWNADAHQRDQRPLQREVIGRETMNPRKGERERENKQMLSLGNYLQTLFIKLTTSFAQFQSHSPKLKSFYMKTPPTSISMLKSVQQSCQIPTIPPSQLVSYLTGANAPSLPSSSPIIHLL